VLVEYPACSKNYVVSDIHVTQASEGLEEALEGGMLCAIGSTARLRNSVKSLPLSSDAKGTLVPVRMIAFRNWAESISGNFPLAGFC
jgi:hypothetical protein